MTAVFIDFSVLVFSFLLLRRISLKHDDTHFSSVGSFFVGLLAWIFLLSVSGWGFLALYLTYLLLSEKVLGAIFGLFSMPLPSSSLSAEPLSSGLRSRIHLSSKKNSIRKECAISTQRPQIRLSQPSARGNAL
jgi:hypothetical protein